MLLIRSHLICSHPCPNLAQANGTLQDFANLRKYSKDWIESSNYIIKSAEILGRTLPMLQVWKLRAVWCIFDNCSRLTVVWKPRDKLCSGPRQVSASESWWCVSSLPLSLPYCQNSLGNSFVRNFIEMQTDISVSSMKETLSNFCEWEFEGLTLVSCRYQFYLYIPPTPTACKISRPSEMGLLHRFIGNSTLISMWFSKGISPWCQ